MANIRQPLNVRDAALLEMKHGCRARLISIGEGMYECHFRNKATGEYVHSAKGSGIEEAFRNAYDSFTGSPAAKSPKQLHAENESLRAQLKSVESSLENTSNASNQETPISGDAAASADDAPVKKKPRRRKPKLDLPKEGEVGPSRF